MVKKGLIVIVALTVMFSICACGKKKEAASEDAAPAKPAIDTKEMVLIPAGDFILGTDDKKSTAYPKQTVNLPAYWIDKYEVTNEQFLDFSIKSGYTTEGTKEGKDWQLFFTPEKSLFPVLYLTWNDATAYCKANGKRLPTEEEWEKAARGPNGNAYPWGNEWADDRSNTWESGTSGKTVAVGQFDDVSFYGVHDMFGNVQEWTGSLYRTYKGNPKKDPQERENWRVIRGLSNRYKGKLSYLWNRSAYSPAALYDFGFRCAKDATPEDATKAAQTK
jgi:formylglycine-generating enzyme required for sulfatase activity